MSAAAKPEIRFALPGNWVNVMLDDEEGVAEVVALLDESRDNDDAFDLRVDLAGLAAAGGDQLLLRTGTITPTVITTSWPLGEETGTPGVEALRARLAAGSGEDSLSATNATELDHRAGYALLRVAQVDERPGATYWLAHPTSGRIYTLTVTMYPSEESDVSGQIELYDALAAGLHWDEARLVTADS